MNIEKVTQSLSTEFEQRSQKYDFSYEFVSENYESLRNKKFMSLLIPKELGGAGATHEQVCRVLEQIAYASPSTALAFSMHQHLVATLVWKYINQTKDVGDFLKKIALNQTVLISTGAKDWLESNGEMKKVDGGYILNCKKHFASQSSYGDIVVTSAPFQDPQLGWQVKHFNLDMKSPGIRLLDNWYTLGMRNTGSQTIIMEDVFVPDHTISLTRSRGEFHQVWNIVLVAAMPLIMSAYIGIANKARSIVTESLKEKAIVKESQLSNLGYLENQYTTMYLNWEDMLNISNNLKFKPANDLANKILIRKTNISNAVLNVVKLGMKISGGQSYYNIFGLEKLFRDALAAHYHPLQEDDQVIFTAKHILSMELS